MILYLLKLLVRVPQSQFVFIRADVIEPRLQRALQQLICTVKIMCVPTPSGLCWLFNVNLLSDIYLDSLGVFGW